MSLITFKCDGYDGTWLCTDEEWKVYQELDASDEIQQVNLRPALSTPIQNHQVQRAILGGSQGNRLTYLNTSEPEVIVDVNLKVAPLDQGEGRLFDRYLVRRTIKMNKGPACKVDELPETEILESIKVHECLTSLLSPGSPEKKKESVLKRILTDDLTTTICMVGNITLEMVELDF